VTDHLSVNQTHHLCDRRLATVHTDYTIEFGKLCTNYCWSSFRTRCACILCAQRHVQLKRLAVVLVQTVRASINGIFVTEWTTAVITVMKKHAVSLVVSSSSSSSNNNSNNNNNKIKQEGWLSPTERAAVSVISLRHILASPGYASGTIAVKCYTDGKRIQCWSNA